MQMRSLARGLGLVESVRWVGDEVWFSDWTSGRILRVDADGGAVELVAHVSTLPLCFDVRDGELTVLDGRHQRVLAGTLTGGVGVELVERVDLSPWAIPAGNEVLTLADGSLLLNFGNFDPAQGFPSEPVGVVAHLDRGGHLRLVAEGLAFPNGMALTPDGSELVVAESHAGRLTAYALGPDGSLTDRQVWAHVPGSAPDGIGMTPSGTVWYADVPARAVVEVERGGRVLRTIHLDRGGFSCAVSPDGSRLAVAAAHWPGGQLLMDPTHDWEGMICVVDLA